MDDDASLLTGALAIGSALGVIGMLILNQILPASSTPYRRGFDAGIHQGMIQCKKQPQRCDLVFQLHRLETGDD